MIDMTAFFIHNPFTRLGRIIDEIRYWNVDSHWRCASFLLTADHPSIWPGSQGTIQSSHGTKEEQEKGNIALPQADAISLGFKVKSWFLVGAGIALMVLGAVMGATSWLGSFFQSLWWIPVTIGIGFFAFSFR